MKESDTIKIKFNKVIAKELIKSNLGIKAKIRFKQKDIKINISNASEEEFALISEKINEIGDKLSFKLHGNFSKKEEYKSELVISGIKQEYEDKVESIIRNYFKLDNSIITFPQVN